MKSRVIAIALVTAALLSAPAPARAQQGGDVVVLKNGGMLRGTVVALEPGAEVTILVMGTSLQRTVPWAEVDHVDRAPVQPAAPRVAAQPPVVQPPAAAPAEPGPGAPRLHVLTDAPNLTLYQDGGDKSGPLCAAPCNRVIDGRVGQTFYFGGEGLASSPSFQLATLSGDVDARVTAGRGWAQVDGAFMILIGGIAVLAGIPILAVGAGEKGNTANKSEGTVLETAGGITSGVGAAVLGGGILLFALAGRTKVQIVPSAQAARTGSFAALAPTLTARGLGWSF